MKKVSLYFLCAISQITYGYQQGSLQENLVKTKIEIAGMAAKDQAIRYEILELQKKYGSNYLIKHPTIFNYWREIDKKNADQTKKIITKWGWLDSKKIGDKCSKELWILVQHADHDLNFQKIVLEKLKGSCNSKAELKHFAYLFDRVQVNQHLPQKYGTQGSCIKAHDWQPFSIENKEGLDNLRKSVGLGPFKAYQKITNKFCF